MYMDGVVREVNVRTRERGIKIVEQGGGRWRVNQLLYADDTVLIGETRVNLQEMLRVFKEVCKRRKFKVNVGKSKVMVCAEN